MVPNNNTIQIKDLKINSLVMAAPLAGISDLVFRSIMREFNQDSLLVTEMISSEALKSKREHKIVKRTPADSPIAFQISGHKPDLMLKSALKLQESADIIDINMGCPTPKIVKNGDGCALMKTPELAAEIVKNIVSNIEIPVSVKFRLGWDTTSVNCVEFAKLMEDCGVSMITVHGRTRNQMYAGKVNWEKIAEVKQAVSIPVIANGDVTSAKIALECLSVTGCDGVAIGRGLLGDPWLLHRVDYFFKTGIIIPEPTMLERLDMSVYHCRKLIDFWGEYTGINHSRKFFGWYIKYLPGAAKYRAVLMQLRTFEEIMEVINEIKSCKELV